jgi:hypothetical protein
MIPSGSPESPAQKGKSSAMEHTTVFDFIAIQAALNIHLLFTN